MSMTLQKIWSTKKPCFLHIKTFRYISHAMVSNSMMFKFNVKDTKCVIVKYYKKIEAYRPIYLDKKNYKIL